MFRLSTRSVCVYAVSTVCNRARVAQHDVLVTPLRCFHVSRRLRSSHVAAGDTPLQAASASVSRTTSFVPPWAARIVGFSAAVTVFVACCSFLSWPLIDGICLPLCYQWSLQRSVRFKDRILPPPFPTRGDINSQELRSSTGDSADDAFSGTITLLSGPALSGKTSALNRIVGDREFFYINCRGFVEGSEVVYGSLSTLVIPLGTLGRLIIAYQKLFNGLADLFTMNQHHTHISHILFAQHLQYIRSSLRLRQRAKEDGRLGDTEGRSKKRPLIVIDQFEQLVEMLSVHGRHSELATFPLLMSKILIRSAIDEGLCDVLLVADSSILHTSTSTPRCRSLNCVNAHKSKRKASPLLREMPELTRRISSFVCVVPKLSTLHTDVRLKAAVSLRSDGMAPGIAGVCLKAVCDAGAVVPTAIAVKFGLDTAAVEATCDALVVAGVLHEMHGTPTANASSANFGCEQPWRLSYGPAVPQDVIAGFLPLCDTVRVRRHVPISASRAITTTEAGCEGDSGKKSSQRQRKKLERVKGVECTTTPHKLVADVLPYSACNTVEELSLRPYVDFYANPPHTQAGPPPASSCRRRRWWQVWKAKPAPPPPCAPPRLFLARTTPPDSCLGSKHYHASRRVIRSIPDAVTGIGEILSVRNGDLVYVVS